MSIEVVEHDDVTYAEVIRADLRVEQTKFFSPAESSFQFGLLAHEAGYREPAHYHKSFERRIDDLQQMFVVLKSQLRFTFQESDPFVLVLIVPEAFRTGVSSGNDPFNADVFVLDEYRGEFLGQ